MKTELANAIYQVLIDNVGAREDDRSSFVYEMTQPKPTSEWRFQGSLGFGGKYRTERNKIDCYREDENPTRLAAIDATNEALKKVLWNDYTTKLAPFCGIIEPEDGNNSFVILDKDLNVIFETDKVMTRYGNFTPAIKRAQKQFSYNEKYTADNIFSTDSVEELKEYILLRFEMIKHPD